MPSMPGEPSALATLPMLCNNCGTRARTSMADFCTPSMASWALRIAWLCFARSVEPAKLCTSGPAEAASVE
jgi:hypothetical protein